jgi:hypothetical protein
MKSNTNKISNRRNTDGGAQPDESDIHMSRRHKNIQTPLSVTTSSERRKGPVATSTKQIAGYFTKLGIENEISRPEKDWPRFALQEVSDNAYDWLNDYYTNTKPVNNSKTRRYRNTNTHRSNTK